MAVRIRTTVAGNKTQTETARTLETVHRHPPVESPVFYGTEGGMIRIDIYSIRSTHGLRVLGWGEIIRDPVVACLVGHGGEYNSQWRARRKAGGGNPRPLSTALSDS
jgi:hypothetical protein